MRYSDSTRKVGDKLGPKLVELVSQTVLSTKLKLLDTEHRARTISMQEIIDRAGHEIADLYRPVFEDMMRDQDMPDSVREHLGKALSGRHQWQAIAGLALGAGGASSALGTVLSNYLAPGTRGLVMLNPQLTPTPEVIAQLGAKGTWPTDNVYYFSKGAGYSDDITTALVQAASSYPDITTAIELLRRGKASRAQAETWLHRNGIPPSIHNTLLSLEEQILSPADLADMVVRGIVTQAEGAKIAAQSGVSSGDFDKLVLDTGEPPGTEQMLEAYRRGFIDKSTLEHGIRQGRTRNEWIPTIERLRYTPMSVADAVNAVVQSHLSQGEGAKLADENGLEPGHFSTLLETAGEPLSRTEMEQLFNRGLVTRGQVEQALRESRLKNKYLTAAFELHRRIIPTRTLHMALQQGAITHEEAVRAAMDDGYNRHDAEVMVTAGSRDALGSFKAETVKAIETMYVDSLMPESEARKLIEGNGYSASQADYILKAATFRKMARIVNSIVSQVRTKYLGHHIEELTASGLLDAAGIPATLRDQLLQVWTAERAAFTRSLTEAQVVKAHKLKLITDDDATGRLTRMGYTPADAGLLLKGA